MKRVLMMCAAAGLTASAGAQVINETSWALDGAGPGGVSRLGGPAGLYAADSAVFAGPTTWVQNLPLTGLTEAQQVFGTASGFGLPLLGGVDRTVLLTAGTRDISNSDAPHDGLAYVLWTATGGADAADDSYRWALGADLLIPSSVGEGGRITFLNDGFGNYNDADGNFFVGPGGSISYAYRGATVDLGVTTGQWFRFIQVANAFAGTSDLYINGVYVGSTGGDWCYNRVDSTSPAWSTGTAVDNSLWNSWGRRPNVFAREDFGFPGTLAAGATLFGDDNGEGERFFVANVYWAEGNICADAVAALGGPSATGFARGVDATACAYPPSVAASFTPPNALPTASSLLTAVVTRGTNPPSPISTVTVDLTPFGGPSVAELFDNGTNGDVTPNDGTYSLSVVVPLQQPSQQYEFLVTVTDQAGRTSSDPAGLYVDDNNSGNNASQWDFEAGTLAITFGPSTLNFWDRAFPGVTESITQFGTTDSFGIPALPGGTTRVMRTARYTGDEGFTVDTASPGNNGSFYVNAYSLVFDVYFPSTGDNSGWFPFHNTNATNSNDADAYARYDTLALGIGALGYAPDNSIQLDRWHRVAFVYDLRRTAAESFHAIYVDGAEVHRRTGFGGFDGRFALYSTTDGEVFDTFHLFTEPSGNFTSEAFINSIYYVDRRLTAEEIADLAGPDADGIYPPECAADFNGDGFIDFFDYDDFVVCFEGGACPPGKSADFNGDGFADFFDFDDFVIAFEAGC